MFARYSPDIPMLKIWKVSVSDVIMELLQAGVAPTPRVMESPMQIKVSEAACGVYLPLVTPLYPTHVFTAPSFCATSAAESARL